MPVTISSKTSTGAQFQITLDKTGADRGTIRIKTWAANANPASADPAKDQTIKLYDIKAAKSGEKLVCRGDVFGPDPTITCTVHPGHGQVSAMVRVAVEGALMFNGTTDYAIGATDQQQVEAFIANAGFPELPMMVAGTSP
jgi:hypothetical protein